MEYNIKTLINIIFMLYILTDSYNLAYGIQSLLYTFHVKNFYDVSKCITSLRRTILSLDYILLH